jgi:hypothetical protein
MNPVTICDDDYVVHHVSDIPDYENKVLLRGTKVFAVETRCGCWVYIGKAMRPNVTCIPCLAEGPQQNPCRDQTHGIGVVCNDGKFRCYRCGKEVHR